MPDIPLLRDRARALLLTRDAEINLDPNIPPPHVATPRGRQNRNIPSFAVVLSSAVPDIDSSEWQQPEARHSVIRRMLLSRAQQSGNPSISARDLDRHLAQQWQTHGEDWITAIIENFAASKQKIAPDILADNLRAYFTHAFGEALSPITAHASLLGLRENLSAPVTRADVLYQALAITNSQSSGGNEVCAITLPADIIQLLELGQHIPIEHLQDAHSAMYQVMSTASSEDNIVILGSGLTFLERLNQVHDYPPLSDLGMRNALMMYVQSTEPVAEPKVSSTPLPTPPTKPLGQAVRKKGMARDS